MCTVVGMIAVVFFFFQKQDGIRDATVTGVQTCALPISVVAVSLDRKSTRLNSSHGSISYAVFCLKKKTQPSQSSPPSTRATGGRVALPHSVPRRGPRRGPGATAAGRTGRRSGRVSLFFFNDTATTEIYTLSLHDALPISEGVRERGRPLDRFDVARGPANP